MYEKTYPFDKYKAIAFVEKESIKYTATSVTFCVEAYSASFVRCYLLIIKTGGAKYAL